MRLGAAELCDEIFDPTTSNRRDPYRLYEALRVSEPVYWDDSRQLWIMTRSADVEAIVRDPSAWSSNPKFDPTATNVRARRTAPPVLSFMDPPEHSRLRRQVSQGFTVAAIAQRQKRVERVVQRLFDTLQRREGVVDIIGDLAHPTPVALICDLLGIPETDRHEFDEELTELAWLFELDPSLDARQRMTRVTLRLRSYFSRLLDESRLDASRNELLTVLGNGDKTGNQVARGELITTAVLLFVAGHVTSMNLIGNAILALLENRSEFATLQRQPGLAKNAVEELLRFDGPVQMVFRIASVDTLVGGIPIRRGQRAALLLGAANRDPAQYAEPNRLNLTRARPHHAALGYGLHHCLGAALARLELEVVVSAFAKRFPHAELTDESLDWQETVTNRGLKRLNVRLSP